MKAIIVVDVPSEMANNDVCVTITSSRSGMSFCGKLNPLPTEKDDRYGLDHYANGWNDCLESIAKGVENEIRNH